MLTIIETFILGAIVGFLISCYTNPLVKTYKDREQLALKEYKTMRGKYMALRSAESKNEAKQAAAQEDEMLNTIIENLPDEKKQEISQKLGIPAELIPMIAQKFLK